MLKTLYKLNANTEYGKNRKIDKFKPCDKIRAEINKIETGNITSFANGGY